jgi:hypothetical protein
MVKETQRDSASAAANVSRVAVDVLNGHDRGQTPDLSAANV